MLVIIAAAAAVLLGVVAVVATSGPSENNGASPDLFTVSNTSFDINVTASGELEARKQIEIRSQVEGSTAIVELVQEGIRVKKGDIVCRLSSEEIETKLEEELLRLESSRSDLIAAENAYEIQINENESAFRKAELALELANIELRKWTEGDLVKSRQDNTLAIDKAERELSRLSEKFKRSQGLYEKDFLSKDELERDEIAYIEAVANLEKAQLQKEVYETYEVPKQRKVLTSNIEEAEAELERTQRRNASQIASKEADLVNKRRQLKIREDRVAKLEEQLEATTIRAPADGLVVYESSINSRPWDNDGPLQIGQDVRHNELILVLPNVDEMVASVRVHESLAGRIQPGQQAMVKIDAVQNAVFKGTVESVSVLAESGGWRDPNLREYTVRVGIDTASSEAASMLKPAMRCELTITLGTVENVIAAPIQAVFNEGRERFVYTPAGGKYRKQAVQIGRRSNQFVEIRNGLDSGSRVLLREPSPGEIMRVARTEQADAKPADEQRTGPSTRPAGDKPAENTAPVKTDATSASAAD